LTSLVKLGIPLLGGLQTVGTIGVVMLDVSGLMAVMALGGSAGGWWSANSDATNWEYIAGWKGQAVTHNKGRQAGQRNEWQTYYN
jgi:hypothetical protein